MAKTPSTDFVPQEIGELSPSAAMRKMLCEAHRVNASDFFLLSEDGYVRVAIRRMGQIEPWLFLSESDGRQLINYVRAMSEVDLGDNLRPADGRWDFVAEPESAAEPAAQSDDQTAAEPAAARIEMNIRVNALPTQFGMDLTLRLLRSDTRLLSIDELGMLPSELGHLKAMLASPSGLILVTGPTGSGKTTTLYACIKQLDDGTRKINTLEDPIEYSIKGVCQSQIAPKVGLDFPELLRNVLRQAPDVILIGEIRDEETAKTAVRAANSGHLVFATLHSHVASQAIQSMVAYGVNPYFLANSIRGVIAQRLLRRLNHATRIEYDVSVADHMFDEVKHMLRHGEGAKIFGPNPKDPEAPGGYDQRTGLFEVMPIDKEVRQMISERANAMDIQARAIELGMIGFRHGALLRIARGDTSVEEMMRVLSVE